MSADIEPVVQALNSGLPAIVPTETVYGVAVRATDARAIDRLIALKGRPPDKPFSIAVADSAQAAQLASLSERARTLIEAHWPGPLTLVLPALTSLHPALTGQLDGIATVGLRCPDHPALRAILQAVGPVALPSANRAGEPPAQTFAEAMQAFDGTVSAGLDGGASSIGTASTVLCLVGAPTVLREGALPSAELLR